MSELQNDDQGLEFDESEAQEAQTEELESTEVNESAELAPDSPDEGEENTDLQEPDWVKERIAKQTYKQRQAERERDEAIRKAKELEEKYERKSLEPVSVPPIPDSWDDDYEAKIKAHVEAARQQERYEMQVQAAKQAEADAQRKAEREEYERSQALQDKFLQNSKKLGVDESKLDEAQQKVVDFGVTPDIANALLNDPDGALIVMHLAANPLELDDIVRANPVEAGLLLANVKSKASALKRKPSSAPDPATTLKGRGAALSKDDDGTTFE